MKKRYEITELLNKKVSIRYDPYHNGLSLINVAKELATMSVSDINIINELKTKDAVTFDLIQGDVKHNEKDD